MADSQEPSYYEIALTNRQVLVAFVILLLCVLAAFFAGVWVGKGSPAAIADAAETATPGPSPTAEPPQELAFFTDGDQQQPGGRPDPEELAERPHPGTTLAQDLGVEPTPEPGAAATAAPAVPSPSPPPLATAAPAATSTPAVAAAGGDPVPAMAPGDLMIQVFSTKDEVQARRLAARLKTAGFKALLSPAGTGAATMYRVRIGPFRDRGKAEAEAARVKRDFKVDTWITSSP